MTRRQMIPSNMGLSRFRLAGFALGILSLLSLTYYYVVNREANGIGIHNDSDVVIKNELILDGRFLEPLQGNRDFPSMTNDQSGLHIRLLDRLGAPVHGRALMLAAPEDGSHPFALTIPGSGIYPVQGSPSEGGFEFLKGAGGKPIVDDGFGVFALRIKEGSIDRVVDAYVAQQRVLEILVRTESGASVSELAARTTIGDYDSRFPEQYRERTFLDVQEANNLQVPLFEGLRMSVLVSAEGYYPSMIPNAWESLSPLEVVLKKKDEGVSSMVLEGFVHDWNGQPAGRAIVGFCEQSAFADENGYFTMQSKWGCSASELTVFWPAGAALHRFRLPEVGDRTDSGWAVSLSLDMPRPSFRCVVKYENGEPAKLVEIVLLSGTKVSNVANYAEYIGVNGEVHAIRTDVNGYFEIANHGAPEMWVAVEYGKAIRSCKFTKLLEGPIQTVVLPDVSRDSISGVVKNSLGFPVKGVEVFQAKSAPGASIGLSKWNSPSVSTDENGKFILPVPRQDGSITIEVHSNLVNRSIGQFAINRESIELRQVLVLDAPYPVKVYWEGLRRGSMKFLDAKGAPTVVFYDLAGISFEGTSIPSHEYSEGLIAWISPLAVRATIDVDGTEEVSAPIAFKEDLQTRIAFDQ